MKMRNKELYLNEYELNISNYFRIKKVFLTGIHTLLVKKEWHRSFLHTPNI